MSDYKPKTLCPHCAVVLSKHKDDGESIKRCPRCNASWFILMCRDSQPTDGGLLDLYLMMEGLVGNGLFVEEMEDLIDRVWFRLTNEERSILNNRVIESEPESDKGKPKNVYEIGYPKLLEERRMLLELLKQTDEELKMCSIMNKVSE